jgi:putative zinc finger/helix-turn-helix YgiT family protein
MLATPFKELSRINTECPVCEAEKDLVYGETIEVLKIRGKSIEVASKIYYCPEGNHYFHAAEDEEEKFQSAYREYRKRKGLLQPEEIKRIREQYGLSQRSFARLLGWGEITIHRYESGAIQDPAQNDVLLLIKDFDDFKKYFESKRHSLAPEFAKKIKEKITAVEKERSIYLLERLFSAKKEDYQMPIRSTIELHYLRHTEKSQSCTNDNELALAA